MYNQNFNFKSITQEIDEEILKSMKDLATNLKADEYEEIDPSNYDLTPHLTLESATFIHRTVKEPNFTQRNFFGYIKQVGVPLYQTVKIDINKFENHKIEIENIESDPWFVGWVVKESMKAIKEKEAAALAIYRNLEAREKNFEKKLKDLDKSIDIKELSKNKMRREFLNGGEAWDYL